MLKFNKENKAEVRIYNYLTERCKTDECLKNKLDSTSKTIAGALGYCKSEAQKIAAGKSSICVDDEQVFEWCVHYFLEDDLKEKVEPAKKSKPTPEVKPTEEPKKKVVKEPKHPPLVDKKKDYEQLRFF